MGDSTPLPDAQIDHQAALTYWNSISPNVDGMLGGFPEISRLDIQGSSNFLAKLRRQYPDTPSILGRAVDCGAGIGRITAAFLSKVCETVDVVEPVEKFANEAAKAKLAGSGKLGDVYVTGLEDWKPRAATYDLIWCQWCLGHLTDIQLAEYLKRCREALTPHGWVVVKENLSTDRKGADIFDEVDSSVTRTDLKYRELFRQAQMKVVKTELQTGFPRGLYPVRFYALRPDAV